MSVQRTPNSPTARNQAHKCRWHAVEARAARRLAQIVIDIGRAFCVLRVKNLAILAQIDTQKLQMSDTLRIFEERVGAKNYELSNHLGNVLATISDKTIFNTDHYNGIVYSAQLYYPFGWEIPTLSYTAKKYRFGFNGKEDDREWHAQDYGFRLYTPREGRFIGVDPITAEYPELTPYQFASNTPIQAVDLDGLEGYGYTRMPTKTFPLTNNDANHLASQLYPDIENVGQRRAMLGYALEEAYLDAIKSDIPFVPNGFYHPNDVNPLRHFVRGDNGKISRPDAFFKIVYRQAQPVFNRPSATFYGLIDVKSQGGFITLTEQIKSYIDDQSRSDEYLVDEYGKSLGTLRAVRVNAAALLLVTLSDTQIHSDVLNYAQSKQVNIFQSKMELNFTRIYMVWGDDDHGWDEDEVYDYSVNFSRPELKTPTRPGMGLSDMPM
jgi:RHS repeat-associated protein